MIVRAAHPSHYAWLAERARCAIAPGFRAIEALEGERILGMVGFGSWAPNSVVVHIAVESPICLRELIPAACDYAFRQAGKGIALGTIPASNGRSLRLAKRVGFREILRVRDGWDRGVDLVVLEMRREHCRWLARKAA